MEGEKQQQQEFKESAMRRKTPKAAWYMWPYFVLRFIVLFGTLSFLAGVGGLLAALFSWMPDNRLYQKMRAWGGGTVFAFEVWLVEKIAKIKVDYYGDKIPMYESAICISNHVMGTDYLIFFPLAYRTGMLGSVRFFAKDLVKYVPLIGWGLKVSGTIFLKRNFEKDTEIMNRALSEISRHKTPCYLVSFLEGTRSTKEKLVQSHEYAKKINLPVEWHSTRQVIVPRYKGFVETARYIQKNAPHVKYVYDFTIMYPDDLISGWMIFNQTVDLRIAVHVKKYLLSEIPLNTTTDGKNWVLDRFMEKEKLLNRVEEQGRPWRWPKEIEEQKLEMPLVLADWCYYNWKVADGMTPEEAIGENTKME